MAADNQNNTTKRGPGRPPGSKNKQKTAYGRKTFNGRYYAENNLRRKEKLD